MALSRKHFVAVAAILSERISEPGCNHAVESVALDLAAFFAAENPNFDRGRFLAAAGVDD